MTATCACGCGQSVKAGRSFARGHNRRSALDLSRYRIEDRGYSTPCWIWTGALNARGYGRVQHRGKHTGAYRVMYEAHIGPIPEGMEIDHLCHQRPCVNPTHLEPVTKLENIARHYTSQTHCKHGHPFSGDNLMIDRNGHRDCRACRQRYEAERQHRRLAA